MPVTIHTVAPKSPCAKKRIKPGEVLVSINDHTIDDVLDYRFFAGEKNPTLLLKNADGVHRRVVVKKDEDADLGLGFETYLMDSHRRCANHCVFCFIDQLPPGLRKSLYFKDDDARLSFLFGNYITLTNLTDSEVRRIIERRISPVNVSVHTTNPTLRVQMMGNARAGESLSYLDRFARAGIALNTQLVLCPGINDGEELEDSLRRLGTLYPALESIAAVPVGLTDHRDGLTHLRAFEREDAAAVIDCIDAFNSRFYEEHQTHIAFPADEFYLAAGRSMPPASFYKEFPQLENGVGLWALFREEVLSLLGDADQMVELCGNGFAPSSDTVTIATGEAAIPLIEELVDEMRKKWDNLKVNVVEIRNRFFGSRITVAGLLTGRDYAEQLQGYPLGRVLLIPAVSLRREGDRFLDDMTVPELAAALNVRVCPVSNDAREFIKAIVERQA